MRSGFIDRLHQVAALAEDDTVSPVSPPIEFQPLAHYTVGDALIRVATRNAHHLGQVIVLRQLMNLWPPAGSWTW